VKRGRTLALFAAVAVAAVVAGVAYQLLPRDPGVARGPGPEAVVGRIFGARLTDVKGVVQPMEQWRGRVLVVNFWATWCAPCREEIPGFVKLQARHGSRGLTFVGIAIDQPEKVAEFAKEFGINYPLLVGGLESMELLREAGNRAGLLPYTLVIDRAGRLVSREPGGLKETRLESLILPLLTSP
jgi:thiol-disulfide isomerase/thioredoxin